MGRIDGRAANELRKVEIRAGVSPYAEGSAEVAFGNTRVLCAASVEKEVPSWMMPKTPGERPRSGWITAEYGMLPRATHSRNKREAAQGKQGGRTLEIQRLIGRALRRAVTLEEIPGLTVRIDCDVIVADGGTRTAAITGGWVALHQALRWARAAGLIPVLPEMRRIAAVSVGTLGGIHLLDLCYEEDASAEFDLNIVADGAGRIIEVQGTGEKGDITRTELDALLDLGFGGINTLFDLQRVAVA